MKNRFSSSKATPENKKAKLNTSNATKIVLFKRKSFQFKASEMEQKKEKFNNIISFKNPDKKMMYLFVEKIYWELSQALNGATVSIIVSYPDGTGDTLYNSRKIPQLIKGVRNINLTYIINEGAEIKVSFECMGYDMMYPNYFLVYKWLDPHTGRKVKETV